MLTGSVLNCHVSNKLMDMEVPQAVLSDSLFEAVVPSQHGRLHLLELL